MILSRLKAALSPKSSNKDLSGKSDVAQPQIPKLEEFIGRRDFTGAIAMLEMMLASTTEKSAADSLKLWLGYSYYHMGNYKKSMELYSKMLEEKNCDPIVNLYLACANFFLGMYTEADKVAQKAPYCKLQNRLLLHLSHKFNDEKRLMSHHQNLIDIVEDQLSLASIHYLRGHYQEAIEVYKRLMLENPYPPNSNHETCHLPYTPMHDRQDMAIHVYVALCYYKLEYYDVSQEVLSNYLQHDPLSITANNLKACNHFKLFNGKAAEAELKQLQEKASPNFRYAEDLIKHNLAVFRDGEGALQCLPPLVDVLPEARLNLCIYHLRNDDIESAMELMKDLEPATPQEYILKAITFTMYAEWSESPEYAKLAQQFFQLVGGSASECDTINGRQCMISCFFLLRQFEDALVYLNSIKSYFANDDAFNMNLAQAKCAAGAYDEAEEALKLVKSEKFTSEYTYISHLARCHVFKQQAQLAWELYLRMDTSVESFNLLHLIGNDCYTTHQYLVSARAFDVLERLDPSPEYWQAKRGACMGTFQQITEAKESPDVLRELIGMLRASGIEESEKLILVMAQWAQETGVTI